MSEWFYQRVNALLGWMTVAVLFVLVTFLANVEIKDLDLWLHLATGKFILFHKTIPHHDIFSFTIANQPWINHEWLFQTIAYATYQLFGVDGLIGLQVLIVVTTIMLLFLLGFERNRNFALSFFLLLVILVYDTRFTIRPDLFSLLFFLIYFHVLSFHLDKRESYLTLFLVQVLWTNIHGFFIMGPFLVFIYLIGEWAKRQMPLPWEWKTSGRLSDEEFGRLKKIFLIVLLACLINPYGLYGLIYPFKILFSVGSDAKIFFKYISELQPPITMQNLWDMGAFLELKLLILAVFVTFLLNYRRLDITLCFLSVLYLLFSLKAIRNVSFFAFVSFIVTARNAGVTDWSLFLPSQFNNLKWKSLLTIMCSGVTIAWAANCFSVASYNGYFDFDKFERKSEYGGISLRNFPHKALNFVVKNKIQGNFFNDFNSGAYLIGRGYDNVRVFIDGRTEMYGASFFEKFKSAFDGNLKTLEELLNQYQPTAVFLGGVQSPIPSDLLEYFYQNKDWTLVYFDDDAVIFLKNIPFNQQWIQRLRIDLNKYQTKKIDLIRLGVVSAVPFEYIHRATNLLSLHLYDKAREEAEEVLRIDPHSDSGYKILGGIYLAQEDYMKAYENFRKAKLLDPNDTEVRYNLSICFYHLGNLIKAEEQVKIALERNPDNTQLISYLALIKVQKGYDTAAMALLNQLDRMPAKTVKNLIQIADLMLEKKEKDKAKDVYKIILSFYPDHIIAKRKLEEIK